MQINKQTTSKADTGCYDSCCRTSVISIMQNALSTPRQMQSNARPYYSTNASILTITCI